MTKQSFNFIMKVFLTSKVMDCVILIDIAIFGNLNVNLRTRSEDKKKSYNNLPKNSACPARRQLA